MIAFQNRKFKIRVENVRLPNGVTVKFASLTKQPGTAIIPMVDKDTILINYQYRVPVRRWIYELPGGKVEKDEAPVHWSELMDNNLTYYGYYIADGPAYSILGPGGGYGGPCPVTEIPGPDINIQQFFAQYGCSVEVTNESYFVIELAQVCPIGTGAKYG